MRGHAVRSRCPRCSEPSLPAPDHRLIECPKCRLAYDWVDRAEAQTPSKDGRGSAPTLDPPDKLTTHVEGRTLQLLLPPQAAHGVSMLAIAVTSAVAGGAMVLASNLPFAAFLIALAVGFGAAGIMFTFTRRRLTVTPAELRVDRVPFGGSTAIFIPVRDLEQLAIARTRRRRHQVVYDIELWAQLTDRDLRLVSTRDANLAHYLEQRIEFHLRIADDGVEMVVPGAE
jgi:hypothetical protein